MVFTVHEVAIIGKLCTTKFPEIQGFSLAMVIKQSKLPPPPRRGPEPRPDLARSGRVALRCHPDIERILELRAREEGVSKSKYVERLLVGWLGADPRNPRMDQNGRFVPGAETPFDLRTKDPVRTAERFHRFSQAHDLLFGNPAPRRYLDEPESFWPAPIGGHVEPIKEWETEEREPVRPKRR
jgi:hypothetical protein